MQRREDVALKIVVVDYQSCAFAPQNLSDKHFLSPKLIGFIAAQQYDFFVGHTFRCIINDNMFRDLLLDKVPVSEQAKFSKAFPIEKITKHIEKHAKTPCLTVSTLDDLVTDQVGVGYADLIDFETNGVITQHNHVQPKQQYALMKENNRQLLLIAQHIAGLYPNKEIQLDIIDDDLKHCHEAFEASRQNDWPKNVKLNKVYRYSTKISNNAVTEITSSSSMLTSGHIGTFARSAAPHSAVAAAAAALPQPDQEPRRSARLASKSRRHY